VVVALVAAARSFIETVPPGFLLVLRGRQLILPPAVTERRNMQRHGTEKSRDVAKRVFLLPRKKS
jgi:hypothetical protein